MLPKLSSKMIFKKSHLWYCGGHQSKGGLKYQKTNKGLCFYLVVSVHQLGSGFCWTALLYFSPAQAAISEQGLLLAYRGLLLANPLESSVGFCGLSCSSAAGC